MYEKFNLNDNKLDNKEPDRGEEKLAIKSTIDTMATTEYPSNISFTIQKINENVYKALDTEDIAELEECLNGLKIHMGYLSEKFRDSREERNYLSVVETVMERASQKIRDDRAKKFAEEIDLEKLKNTIDDRAKEENSVDLLNIIQQINNSLHETIDGGNRIKILNTLRNINELLDSMKKNYPNSKNQEEYSNAVNQILKYIRKKSL